MPGIGRGRTDQAVAVGESRSRRQLSGIRIAFGAAASRPYNPKLVRIALIRCRDKTCPVAIGIFGEQKVSRLSRQGVPPKVPLM